MKKQHANECDRCCKSKTADNIKIYLQNGCMELCDECYKEMFPKPQTPEEHLKMGMFEMELNQDEKKRIGQAEQMLPMLKLRWNSEEWKGYIDFWELEDEPEGVQWDKKRNRWSHNFTNHYVYHKYIKNIPVREQENE